MKKTYTLGEDLFMVLSVLLMGAAIVLRLFDAKINLGLVNIGAGHLLTLGVVSLLYNIALNLQELARK